MRRSELYPILLVALAITFWALSFIFIKLALREMSAWTLIILRYALGFGLLAGVLIWRGEWRQFKRADLRAMIWLGLVGVALQQVLQVSGQVTADASVAAFLASSAPAFMIVLAALCLREPVRRGQWFGVALATLGAMWVASNGDLPALLQGRLNAPGNWLVLLSAVVWAVYTIMTRSLMQGRPPTLLTGGMFGVGWLAVLPFFLLQRGWRELAQISLSGWTAVVVVGVFSTALTYLLYGHALKLAPASRLAGIQNIEPLIATIAAACILGEQPGTSLLVGGCAILGGIYLAERKPQPEHKS